MTNPRVAIITGGSSGIGLALTTHLVSQGWTTVIADLQTPPDTILGPFIHYHHTDVSSYASLKSLFSFAFSLYSRVDFVALNAGIDDRDDIFNSINLEGDVNAAAPAEPDMRTFETNLFGVYYGIKLFAHYHARNSLLTDQDGEKGGKNRVGKIIITASNVGLYPMPAAPQYCAAKHALIGLTRSLAPKAAKQGITINAVCPAIVETSIMPPLLKENIPAEIMTPMSTVIRAFEALLADGEGDVEGTVALGKNGETVEATVDMLYYRGPVEWPDDNSRKTAGPWWDMIYEERNMKFARENEERARRKREQEENGWDKGF